MSEETEAEYQARRRAELAATPSSKAKPIPTKGEGTKGNTAHLNLTTQLEPDIDDDNRGDQRDAAPVPKRRYQRHSRFRQDARRRLRNDVDGNSGASKAIGRKAGPRALHKPQERHADHQDEEGAPGPLSAFQSRYRRRIAQAREIAGMGLTQTQAAKAMGLATQSISAIAKKNGIQFVSGQRHIKQLVIAGYRAGLSPPQIAEQIGTSVSSVKVTASKLKITDRTRDTYKVHRSFILPPEYRQKYMEMRHTGLTQEEAGMCLGLLQRPGNQRRITACPSAHS